MKERENNMKNHLTDHKALKRPDLFQSNTSSLMEGIAKNKALFFGSLFGIFGFALAMSLYSSYQLGREEKAAGVLFLGQNSVSEKAKEKSSSTQSAKVADTSSAAALTPVVTAELSSELLKNYSGTVATYETFMRQGDMALQKGEFDKAQAAYETATNQAASRFMRLFAMYGTGYAKEGKKDYAGAITTFQTALRLGEKSLKVEILTALQRNYELSGDKAKAEEQKKLIATETASATPAGLKK